MPKNTTKIRTLTVKVSCNRKGASPESWELQCHMPEPLAMERYRKLCVAMDKAYKESDPGYVDPISATDYKAKLELAEQRIAHLENIQTIQTKQIERLMDARDAEIKMKDELLRGCEAAIAYLADPPSKFKENRDEAERIIRDAITKAKGKQ